MSRAVIALALAAALGIGLFGGYRYAMHRSMTTAQAPAATESSKPVLYWYDPMYPQQKFDKPGKSPFMDMQLVPKYAGDAEQDAGTVSVNPRVVQNLGMRTAEAKTGSLESRFEAVGSVVFNERGVVQLQARAAGFVETLHARAPLDPVAKGAPLVTILYPEWAGAQEEFLLLLKSKSPDLQALAGAARQRLLLLGMTEGDIAAVEREEKTRTRVTLTAPISGVIAELGVREGMTVTAGSPLFRIVDLSTVWVNAEVPETQAGWIRPGGSVEARAAAYPGAVFKGKVGVLLPEVDTATRTVRARIELPNPGGRLKPGMYATLSFSAPHGKEAVLVPSEAVIRTGTRDVVIVALGEGKFRAANVQVGAESGGQSEIRQGLRAGERVVLSGQFLIDSEASLSSTVARLEGSGEATKPGAQAAHAGRGTVKDVDARAGWVELDHEPIPSMRWPAMIMGFTVEDKAQLAKIRKGDAVQFELRGQPDKEGNYVISRIGANP
jgi:membrane fusion protein, copper/silver efflux system